MATGIPAIKIKVTVSQTSQVGSNGKPIVRAIVSGPAYQGTPHDAKAQTKVRAFVKDLHPGGVRIIDRQHIIKDEVQTSKFLFETGLS